MNKSKNINFIQMSKSIKKAKSSKNKRKFVGIRFKIQTK